MFKIEKTDNARITNMINGSMITESQIQSIPNQN